MERYERPQRWKRHPPDIPEMSSRSQMGDRERAEAGSVEVHRRVVRNWAYLVEAATKRADLDSATTLIEAVVEVADEIRAHAIDCRVAYILYRYALNLAAQLEPSTEGRCLLQFKSALKYRLMERSGRTRNRYYSEDTLEIIDYIRKLRWEEDIVNLEAEEHAAQEGWALEGEDPSYHAWRMEKLSRFYKILNILNKALQFFSADVESKIGSIRINNPFHHYQPVDLVDLHQKLFIASASSVSYREQPSLEIIMTTVAAFFKLHDETLARDLEQIVNVNAPINKSYIISKVSDFLGRITNNNAPKHIFNMPSTSHFSLLKTRNLLSLCMEEVQKSAKHFSSKGASGAYVMNENQCYLLVHVLQETESTLARVFKSQHLEVHPISALGELLFTLHEAHTLIDASCITRSESQWPREAFEQGDMSHTFSQVLYNVIWHSCVLWDMVACDNCTRESYELFFKCKGPFGRREALEVLLSEAVEKDEKSLKHRLKIMKVVDPMNQGLAHQFLDRMEAPSSNLVRLDLDDFDLKGASHIGSGSYGAVVKYNFLGRQCAMKVIKANHGHEGSFEKEIDAAKKLGNHPNLVRLHCYSTTEVACYLIMEELQMDLSIVLMLKNKNGEGLSMVEAVALMLQIGEGLKHIHDKGAAHRDLKPGNILVNLVDPSSKYLSRICSVKIADFGLTKTQAAVRTCSNHTKNKGTSVYMAPEVMKSDTDGSGSTRFNPAKADIFSLGVVCSEILTRETPYKEIKPKEFKKQVKAGTLRPNLPTNCPPRLTTLITRCWDGDYKKRPLLPEICGELRYIKRLLLMYMDGARHKTSH